MSDLKTRLEDEATVREALTEIARLTQERDDWKLSFEKANEIIGNLEQDIAKVRTWAEMTKNVTGCEYCRQAAWDVLDILFAPASVPKE